MLDEEYGVSESQEATDTLHRTEALLDSALAADGESADAPVLTETLELGSEGRTGETIDLSAPGNGQLNPIEHNSLGGPLEIRLDMPWKTDAPPEDSGATDDPSSSAETVQRHGLLAAIWGLARGFSGIRKR